MCRSEPQTPVASMRTIASRRSSSSGSGRSSTATSPGAWKVTARMPAAAYRPPARELAPPPDWLAAATGQHHAHDRLADALALQLRFGGERLRHEPGEQRVHAPCPGDRARSVVVLDKPFERDLDEFEPVAEPLLDRASQLRQAQRL